MIKIKRTLATLLIVSPFWSISQTTIPLNDLSWFNSESNNWSIVGNVNSSTTQKNTLTSTPGTGILKCRHDQKEYGEKFDIFTKESYGDMDLKLDFMMAQGSNSGIYLQGRYEIQLNDSWGVIQPKFYDCGGVYQRRDLTKPDGQNQYEGYAPRFNAYKAPGLWNTIEISYQAPRFDDAGNKTSNAKLLSVKLNGLLIHENIEMSGPTGGAIEENEVTSAPLRFQGDHGAVAFRNIEINHFNKKPGYITDLTYKTYYGWFMHNADLSKEKIGNQGKTDELTWEVTKEPNDYAFFIKGKYHAPEDGEYTFVSQIGGHSYIRIDDQYVHNNIWTNNDIRTGKIFLKKGIHDIEIFNNKRDAWVRPALGIWSAGPGFRLAPHHPASSVTASNTKDPIIIKANTHTNLRSFMDWKKNPGDKNFRVVHAISVGSPDQLHYTYDLDKGAIIQVWKGDFLDTTPMWDDRGDGSSKPLGSLTLLDHDLFLNPLGNLGWKADTVGTGYKPLGYDLDENGQVTFNYRMNNQNVSDKIRTVDKKYFTREVKVENGSELVAKLASGNKIELIEPGLYAIDDKTYFIKIENGESPLILNQRDLLVRPEGNLIKYAIIF